MPASSIVCLSIISYSRLFFSHHLKYILNNISAQSWASVPPAPALTLTIAFSISFGSFNNSFNSRFSTSFFNIESLILTSFKVFKSFSSSPSWVKTFKSSIAFFKLCHCSTIFFIDFSLFKIFFAFSGLLQKDDSPIFFSISNNSFSFLSISKITP